MKTRLAAAAVVLALTAPVAAVARPFDGHAHAAWTTQSVDSSAKAGNAAQPERAVPQYGNTSGGPLH